MTTQTQTLLQESLKELVADHSLDGVLEQLVDNHSIEMLLLGLIEVCNNKASHLEENWQDSYSAKTWKKLASKIDKIA